MNKQRFSERVSWLREELRQMESVKVDCSRCLNFEIGMKMCRLVDKTVPAEVLPTGCPSWEFDGVPF